MSQKRKVVLAKSFKRDAKKRYLDFVTEEWAEVFACLVSSKPLDKKYQDHALTGNWNCFRDCHIKPDLVLIYKLVGDDILELHQLDSHSEIFG